MRKLNGEEPTEISPPSASEGHEVRSGEAPPRPNLYKPAALAGAAGNAFSPRLEIPSRKSGGLCAETFQGCRPRCLKYGTTPASPTFSLYYFSSNGIFSRNDFDKIHPFLPLFDGNKVIAGKIFLEVNQLTGDVIDFQRVFLIGVCDNV